MGDTAAHVHWLVDVAVRAGLLQSGALAVAPNAALPDAWARVSAGLEIASAVA